MTVQTIKLVPKPTLRTEDQASGLETTVATALICKNSLLRSGLQQILRETPFVLAEAGAVTGPRLIQDVPEPALFVIQANQDTSSMLEAVRAAKQRFPKARVVVLADQFDLGFVRIGLQAGVDGFCEAASSPEVLIKSLELVMLGGSVLPSAIMHSVLSEMFQNPEQPLHNNPVAEPEPSNMRECKLSVREAQILGCLMQGSPNKIIARNLDIAEATIKVHVKAILRKIGVANRTQAAMWATGHLPRQGEPSGNA
ncbi:response regulator transcription factor [Microvirga aerilata]|uniref:Response regulator transcription factor n=1 Tax=Microvirga aerilata TaxID=670292 RepID=A0A937D4S1_9HYPH|nr:response regulator transcription factor [Microvirga aerilata]MBL0407865.1 response regulator transcription factor [Microvirga aerilata]